jgi:CelD/BcsL family acetyltransferase involved in cellulose biosynthesis
VSLLRIRVAHDFDDPAFTSERWSKWLAGGDTDVVFLTLEWLRAWWQTLGRGTLLVTVAERAGEVIAVAPLYADMGQVYFVGSGEAEYLDFIGEISDPIVLESLLAAARDHAPDFSGFELALVPDQSRSNERIQAAAAALGMNCYERYAAPGIEIDLAGQALAVRDALSRSLLRKEEYFRRHGPLAIRTLTDAAEIRPYLNEFCAHHVARWERKDKPSDLVDLQQRAFLGHCVDRCAETGWLRFLLLEWKGRFLAGEFCWHYRGTHYPAPWCFDIAQANRSPGRVLLRNSLLAALDAGLRTYDLGGGDPDHNFKIPVRTKVCRTWGLYPP